MAQWVRGTLPASPAPKGASRRAIGHQGSLGEDGEYPASQLCRMLLKKKRKKIPLSLSQSIKGKTPRLGGGRRPGMRQTRLSESAEGTQFLLTASWTPAARPHMSGREKLTQGSAPPQAQTQAAPAVPRPSPPPPSIGRPSSGCFSLVNSTKHSKKNYCRFFSNSSEK